MITLILVSALVGSGVSTNAVVLPDHKTCMAAASRAVAASKEVIQGQGYAATVERLTDGFTASGRHGRVFVRAECV